jgi:small subunit ribosomal protein S6
MTRESPTYDLVILLDPQAPEDARTKILTDTRAMIAARGEVVRDDSWGDRALAYPIDRKTDAQYQLIQFKASTPELLGELSRTLQITDGIIRFRIVKLKPGTPDPPEMRPGSASSRPAEEAPVPVPQTAETAPAEALPSPATESPIPRAEESAEAEPAPPPAETAASAATAEPS